MNDKSIQTIKKKCLFCKKIFFAILSEHKRGKSKFCSKECCWKARIGKGNPNFKHGKWYYNTSSYQKWWRENSPKGRISLIKNRKYGKKRRELLKREALKVYSNGKMKCACCGENQYKFLTLDHIDNDGNKHRKEFKGRIYDWLKARNYPKDIKLQVLCWNCNMSKAHFGKCPHHLVVEVPQSKAR